MFGHAWLMGHEGRPSREQTIMEPAEDRGSPLLGGCKAGHKGFGLGLMVEALTQGLSGHGRRDAPKGWGASVHCQLIDPGAFAGQDAFVAQMDFLADGCHATPPLDPARPGRLPGEQASRNISQAEAVGVLVSAQTRQRLLSWARKLNVDATMLD